MIELKGAKKRRRPKESRKSPCQVIESWLELEGQPGTGNSESQSKPRLESRVPKTRATRDVIDLFIEANWGFKEARTKCRTPTSRVRLALSTCSMTGRLFELMPGP